MLLGRRVDGMQILRAEIVLAPDWMTWYTGNPINCFNRHSYTKNGRKYPESTDPGQAEDILDVSVRSWSGSDE